MALAGKYIIFQRYNINANVSGAFTFAERWHFDIQNIVWQFIP